MPCGFTCNVHAICFISRSGNLTGIRFLPPLLFGSSSSVMTQTSTGTHAYAHLWSLLGRQLDIKLHPDTEALHKVRKQLAR